MYAMSSFSTRPRKSTQRNDSMEEGAVMVACLLQSDP